MITAEAKRIAIENKIEPYVVQALLDEDLPIPNRDQVDRTGYSFRAVLAIEKYRRRERS